MSASISGWESLSPIFTAEWQAMVARMWSSRRWPGSVPEMAERASLNAPAISLSASVEITAVTLTDLGQNGPFVRDVLVDDPERLGLLEEDVTRGELPYDPQVLGGGLR